MATHSNNFIRVRLHFEYPPPAVVDCRMCWLLVDLNRCRVVADLESVIREKFEFGRRSILSLFIEDCYLPHTESVYVVRDNDSVRVKVDHLAQVNGHSTSPSKKEETSKKRQRPTEEDEPGDKQKKKKRKKRSEESQETDAKQADVDEGNKKSHEKHQKKKKRKEVETVTPAQVGTKKSPASVDVQVKSPKKLPSAAKPPKVSSSDSSSEEEDEAPKKTAPKKPASVNQPVKSIKKLPPAAKTQKASSSDSSSSSEEEEKAPKKTAPQKTAPQKTAPQKTAPKPLSAASKTPPVTKPALKKINPPSSTSTDSSSDEEESLKNLPKKRLFQSAIPTNNKSDKPQQAPLLSTGGKTSSDSEEEIKLVIRRPLHPAQQLGRGAGGQAAWRGRGLGRGSPADRERGRGGGRGGGRGHGNSFEYNYNGYKEPSAQTYSLTNLSVVLQNGAESVPKPDYSSMPLLAAPPLVGQKIAFKLLELTENYTPEVSEYKEGKIVNFDPLTKQVELELLHASQAPVEPGKFDLVYQNEDGSERVEYAVSRGSKVTERWDSLLEPRLIL